MSGTKPVYEYDIAYTKEDGKTPVSESELQSLDPANIAFSSDLVWIVRIVKI